MNVLTVIRLLIVPQEVAKKTNDFVAFNVFELLQMFSLFLPEVYKDKDKMVYEYPRKFKPFHETIEKELSRNLEWNFLLRFSLDVKNLTNKNNISSLARSTFHCISGREIC